MTNRTTLPTLGLCLSFWLAAAAPGAGQTPGAGHHASHGASRESRAGFSVEAAAFLSENDRAMVEMMAAMDVAPSGDIDRDFVEMMIPHHQGAIDSAKAVLRYSRNDQIRRMAQEIIVTQQQEIAAMRLAVGDPLPPSRPSPTQIAPLP